jgi:hypothetical protein
MKYQRLVRSIGSKKRLGAEVTRRRFLRTAVAAGVAPPCPNPTVHAAPAPSAASGPSKCSTTAGRSSRWVAHP